MHGKLFIVTFISMLSFCCQGKRERKILMPDYIERVSILEFNGFVPYFEIINDTIVFNTKYDIVVGITEIDKDFNLKIIRKDVLGSRQYMYGEVEASDSLRKIVIETIHKFSNDSIDTEDKLRIYDGNYYFILIEKMDKTTILLSGYPDNISIETQKLSNFYRDSTERHINKSIKNQDSIREYMREYEKFFPENLNHPTIPLLPIIIKDQLNHSKKESCQ